MHLVYFIARTYPFIALALCAPLFQLFLFYRKKQQALQWVFLVWMVFQFGSIGIWVLFRGDINSDRWIASTID